MFEPHGSPQCFSPPPPTQSPADSSTEAADSGRSFPEVDSIGEEGLKHVPDTPVRVQAVSWRIKTYPYSMYCFLKVGGTFVSLFST